MFPIDYGHLVPLMVDTMIFAFRVLAGALSVIAMLLWWRLRHSQERPPYSRRLNDIAWSWFHAGAFIGAVSFIALDLQYRRITGDGLGDVMVLLVWWCWANAATVRLAARADRPRFVYMGATIFVTIMPLYALATGG
ncbi:hypothetical protein [Qipengyuania sp.]|uniref:hypothetical protein n=1 Tax=Qipengyuania sp. TaxID=2004515 RepID=UPI0035C835F4